MRQTIEKLEVLSLTERPGAIGQAASWLNAEWGSTDGHSLQDTRDWIEDVIAGDGKECARGAFAGTELLGVALLVDCDLPRRADLTPWLSGLYVTPDARGRGIGSRLTAAIDQAAADFGFSRYYLYSNIGNKTGFYEPLGWCEIEAFDHKGKPFAVMEKTLGC